MECKECIHASEPEEKDGLLLYYCDLPAIKPCIYSKEKEE